MSDTEVDLGGCGGCGLGCALACASPSPGRDRARAMLTATGVALLLLGAVPGVVAGAWVRWPAAATGVLGVVIALLGAAARRVSGAPAEHAARWAYRLVPVGTAALVATWLATAAHTLLG